jgi:hypothetical protein
MVGMEKTDEVMNTCYHRIRKHFEHFILIRKSSGEGGKKRRVKTEGVGWTTRQIRK